MVDLVLLGIGALVTVSLRRLKNETAPGSAPNDQACSNLEKLNLASITNVNSVQVQGSKIDWKRFWELFSSDRDLTEEEKSEMNALKEKLSEMHRTLEAEGKRRMEDLRRTIQFQLADLKISEDRGDYLVHRDDYKRGSTKEREYIRQHRNFLFRTYDNRCAKCRDDSNGLDLDHFFFSKNEGGCFEMLHRGGFKVNNAIPLCESCNRSKSDRNFRSFFSPHELLWVMECNGKMNVRLNQQRIRIGSGGNQCQTFK